MCCAQSMKSRNACRILFKMNRQGTIAHVDQGKDFLLYPPQRGLGQQSVHVSLTYQILPSLFFKKEMFNLF